MSFRKFQIISPYDIGCPDYGHIYLGRDDFGLWEKWDDCSVHRLAYIRTGYTDGTSGTSGLDGVFFGTSGTSGESGSSGTSGKDGSSGKTGLDGTSGISGSSGTSGKTGSSGTSGKTGSSGTSGIGTSGSSGVDGTFYGSSGMSGTSGMSGYGGSARKWIFSTSSLYPTTPGTFYANDSGYGLTNIDFIRINEQDSDGQLVDTWISSWVNGILKIENFLNPSIFGIYAINSGITTNTKLGLSWYSISGLTLYDGDGYLSHGDDYLISYVVSSSNGSSGTSGTGSPGTSGTSGSGSSGASGTSGSSGSGTSGTSGTGSPGTSGSSGIDGSGTSGTSGTGSPGTSGSSGIDGSGTSGTSGSLDTTITAEPSIDHTVSGLKIILTASGATNFGDVGYINSFGTVTLANATTISTANAVVMCADESISANNSGNWLLFGIARNDSWNWTSGGTSGYVYLSTSGTTSNTMTQTAPSGVDHVIQLIGVATSSTRILFKPSLVQVEHL